MISEKEFERIERIMNEATRVPPLRIYHDDALFLIEIIQRLVLALEGKAKGDGETGSIH